MTEAANKPKGGAANKRADDEAKYCRPLSQTEIWVLRENQLDSDGDLALLLCRPRSEICRIRRKLGLMTGKQVDDARRAAEAQ